MASDRAVLCAAFLLATAAAAEPLVGASVGNADTLVSEGSKLYNRKQYAKAAESFLRASRANPSALPTYLQLARSYLSAKQTQRGCYVYRVYLKASSDTPERKKAQAEAEQCERQLKTAKNQPADMTQKYVESRAAFFAALEKGELVGPSSASKELEGLVKDGFVGPDLGDMALKLSSAAVGQADEVHRRALSFEKLSTETLRSARPLYQVAQDAGAPSHELKPRQAFLDGLAALQEKEFKRADGLFADAAKADSSNKEYVYFRAVALFQAGDRKEALKVMESELKDDPRTAVLRASVAMGQSTEAGSAELERMLFSARFPSEK